MLALTGRLADGGIVQPQFGRGFAGVESKIPGRPIALLRGGIVGGERGK